MTRPSDASARRRTEAYFVASYEVARRLAEGRADEAIAVLRRELDRIGPDADETSRRFLLSQIALCQARSGDATGAMRTLEQMEDELPRDHETSLMLAEGWLLLAGHGERASHHAADALRLAEEAGEDTPEVVSAIKTLIARALLAEKDLVGAFAAWEASPLPSWRVGADLIDAGFSPDAVRRVLAEALPRIEEQERRAGAEGVCSSDRVRRMIAWIDQGCPSAG
ncbi:MAG: hypothetical protein Kow0062_17900 [Acidobacteriota bacterium]